MCYELSDFDPFESILIWEDIDLYIDSEPMTVDDWVSWLATDEANEQQIN